MIIPTLNPNDLNLNNPIVQSILSSLDIVLSWARIHESVFERFESKKYFGFQLFALSPQYANSFKSILALLVPVPNSQTSSLLSSTKIEKLDNVIN
jgi:hypothetical protein